MRKITAAVAAAVAVTLAPAPQADAATATIEGMFMPRGHAAKQYGGALCQPSCESIRYTNVPTLSGWTVEQGADALDAWIAALPAGEQVTVNGYSLGSMVAAEYMARHAADVDARPVTFILTGAPTENAYQHSGGRDAALPAATAPVNPAYDVVVVTRQYDPVADKAARSSWYSTINSLSAFFSVHTDYTDVDLDDPRNVNWVDEATGVRYVYVPTDVLPMLQWRDWFTSDERMAELDAKYRPLIEADYDRPVEIPAPAVAEVEPVEAEPVDAERPSARRDDVAEVDAAELVDEPVGVDDGPVDEPAESELQAPQDEPEVDLSERQAPEVDVDVDDDSEREPAQDDDRDAAQGGDE